MTLFRKRPEIFEAWQFNGEDRLDWPDWLRSEQRVHQTFNPRHISVETSAGRIFAFKGDWVVCTSGGELIIESPESFALNYEEASDGV